MESVISYERVSCVHTRSFVIYVRMNLILVQKKTGSDKEDKDSIPEYKW